MTASTAPAPSRAPSRQRRRLPHGVAFVLVAYAFGVTMMGTTLPTPLYPLYQQRFDFGGLTTTVVYAVYAAGVIAALLGFGRASDLLGRRRVLLVGLCLSAISAAVFLVGGSLPVLFVGRVLSGLSAGVMTATATVAVVELAPARRHGLATLVATGVNMVGLGCGPLLTGLLAAGTPAPLRLPFVAALVLLVPAVLGVWRAPETGTVQPGAFPRPQRPAVPAQARAVFLPAALAAFAAFAVLGLVTAIEPSILAELLHLPSPALAGTIVFGMFVASALGQAFQPRLSERAALPAGCVLLIAGLAVIAVALLTRSLSLLIVGVVISGLGHGIGFRSGMAAISAASPDEQRAETVSSFFVAAYIGISVPIVLVGIGTALWGLETSAVVFTGVVAGITLVALIAIIGVQRREQYRG